jgi:hypothetical protein
MEDNAGSEKSNKLPNFGALAYISSIYFIATGIAYLWAYWSAFSVNILEYLAIADVLKHAAFPVASAVASIALGLVFGSIFGAKRLPPGGGKNTPVGRALNKYKRAIFSAALLLVVGLYFLRLPQYLPIFPFLAALLVAIPIGNLPQFQRLLPDEIRYSVVLFLCALPFLAFSVGESRAAEIVDGTRFRFLVDAGLEPVVSLRYVGHAGEEYFFYEPKIKAIVLIKRPDKPLVFAYFKR